MDISFEIYNEDAVKRLQEEDPDILPEYSIDEEKDLAYNKKQVNAAITSAILQGKSIPNIASDLSSRMKTTNQQTAVKAARTAVTSAQNGGRLESFYKAKEMGIDVKKKWMATLDSRTRPRHRDLDGEIREVEEAFSNGLMYPGDSSGSAGEVWWCRCRLGKYLPDVDMSDSVRWSRNLLTGEREYTSNKTMVKWGADILRPQYSKVSKIKTAISVILEGMSDHSLWQAFTRGITPEEIIDAVENPLKVNGPTLREDGQYSQRFIGYFAIVNINPETGVLSTLWKTGKRIRRKFGRE